MDTSTKVILALVGLPILLILASMSYSGQTDKAKFDRLQIGMSTSEVQAIMDPPRSRKYPQRESLITDNAVVQYEERMILVMRDGVLAEKTWLGKN